MVGVERFSSMDRLLWVASYVLQFTHNIKLIVMKILKLRTGFLTSEEFDNSETLRWKHGKSLLTFDCNCICEKSKFSFNLYEDGNNI